MKKEKRKRELSPPSPPPVFDEPAKKNNKLKPKPDEEKFVTNIHRMILIDKYSFFQDTGGKAI